GGRKPGGGEGGASHQISSMRRFAGDHCSRGIRSVGAMAGRFTSSLGRRLLAACFFLLRNLLRVVLVNYSRHVSPGFAKRRNALILVDSLRASIISGQRLHQVKIVTLKQFAQIPASTVHVR